MFIKKGVKKVCIDSLHPSGKGEYVLINNYIDKVWFFRSSSVPTDEHTQNNSRVNENHALQDDLQILKDVILSSPKNPVIAHLK